MAALRPEQLAEMQEAFDLFDTDGGGSISCLEFKALFKCFGMKFSDDQISEFVLQYDED